MADNRINLPSGSGGIVRYFDKSTSKIEFPPETLVGALIVLIILMTLLHLMWSGVL